MECPDHFELSVGSCETCSREVCELCLEEVESPEDFECPDCGEYGIALFDEDYGEMTSDEGEEETASYDM